jgi:endoglucanase
MRDLPGLDLLRTLVETPAVPGREDRIRALIGETLRARGLADEIRTDALGSLVALRHPRGGGPSPVRLLVAAHMDQVGFLVSHVGDGGFLRLHPVGAFDLRVLPGQRVRVVTEAGDDLPGMLMPESHPVHTAGEGQEKQTPRLRDLYVDLGSPSHSGSVRPGDMVVFDAPFRDLGDAVVGPALDDRIGCWALIEALAATAGHACEIHAIFSVQEELGSRGIEPLANGVAADVGIAVDTLVAADTPGVPGEQSVTRLGAGAALLVADSSTLADMDLVRRLEALGRARGIEVQRALMEGGGQDGAYVQRSRQGVRTAVIGCPVRYMHTSGELARKSDLLACQALLAGFMETL